ncbi:hypothetical protein B0H13DRAFT_2314602 [Mycena leptocephala]|nr:hypothetical protein B0H13DRAFT_2314602 [Mycena leptocephala]
MGPYRGISNIVNRATVSAVSSSASVNHNSSIASRKIMTRSELTIDSPRVVRRVCKALRAEAAGIELTYHYYKELSISTKVKEEAARKKVEKPVGTIRRNYGRMDGVRWNGASFVCGRQVDGDDLDAVSEEREDDVSESPDRRTPLVMSLLDIARPAKRRGVAKKSEVLPTIRRVIELDDSIGDAKRSVGYPSG